METAISLIAEAKKQREENILMNYKTWARNIASEIEEDGFYENKMYSDDKTFSSKRHFIRYLRKIGFKVTFLEMKRYYYEGFKYTLKFRVTLDNTDYKEDLY